MDEAALLIRFKDETEPGRAGGATSAQGQAASGGIPGTNLGAEFQDNLGQAGAAARQANEELTKVPLPDVPAFTPVPPVDAAPIPQVVQPQQGGQPADGLLAAVQQILAADRNTTVQELQRSLGIPSGRAQNLLSAALAASQPAPVPPAAVQPIPAVATTPVQPATPAPAAAAPVPPAAPAAQPAAAPQPAPAAPVPPPVPPPLPTAPTIGEALEAAQGILKNIPGAGAAAQLAGRAAAIPAIGSLPIPPALAGALPALSAAAGPALGIAAVVAAGAAGVAATVAVAESARGQIGGLSGELAAAEAEARVRQLVANMRTAEMLGDEVAGFVENRSRLAAAGQGLRDVAFEPLIGELNKVVSGLATITELLNAAATANKPLTDFLQARGLDALYMAIGPNGWLLRSLVDQLGILGKIGKAEEDAASPWTHWINQPHVPLPAWLGESDQAPAGNAVFAPVPGLSL